MYAYVYMYTCVRLQVQLYLELLKYTYKIVTAPFIKLDIDNIFTDPVVINWLTLSLSIINLSIINNISNGNAIFSANLVTIMDCVQFRIMPMTPLSRINAFPFESVALGGATTTIPILI